MIDPDFIFSQYSLQDYLDCPRRFQLRHLLHLAWPSAETDDQVAHGVVLDQGRDFHRCVQQYFCGVPAAAIQDQIQDGQLLTWWQAFLPEASRFPWLEAAQSIPQVTLPEFQLTGSLGSHLLTAKYDLLAVRKGIQSWIYDWKTAPRIPKHEALAQRIQTRLYCWLLAECGQSLNQGSSIPPDQISMTYWFVQHPSSPVLIPYTSRAQEADRQYLDDLLSQVDAVSAGDFPLTEDLRRCRYCPYRSYCERGLSPGSWSEMQGDPSPGNGLDELPSWEDLLPSIDE